MHCRILHVRNEWNRVFKIFLQQIPARRKKVMTIMYNLNPLLQAFIMNLRFLESDAGGIDLRVCIDQDTVVSSESSRSGS